MNAILQCVTHTPLLRNYYTSGLYQAHVNKKVATTGILSEVVADFFREYEHANDPIDSLRKIKNAIGKYIPQFQGYDQHDAQEFLAMMLDKLITELTRNVAMSAFPLAKTAPSGFNSGASPVKSQQESKEDSKGAETERKISVMDDLFCGELTNVITCPNCNKVSEKKESFYYLSLPLPQEVHIPTSNLV
ncbi:MAG: ubiquitin carboxyl-terminal hydrolase family protein [Candidatus Pacebacteria bacterium]|nr:ubiquitin carboxyl-terminal hydrolase family protein [Candidatus Paceibacterota bacterium]